MYRKGNENIGRVIVFSMVIIIAGVFAGLLTHFYKESLTNKSYVSILGNKLSSIKDIHALGICKTSSYAKIDYNPLNDTYTLTCENQLGKNISKFPEIIIIKDCQPDSNVCKYKFRN